MREAKLAASVFGVITACLIGGGVVAYNAAPQVSTRDNFEIVEPAYNGITLTAETSNENKTAITEPTEEKTETKRITGTKGTAETKGTTETRKPVSDSYKRASAVKLSSIADSTEKATATTNAATSQSVTETDSQKSTDQPEYTTGTNTTDQYTTENNDTQWTTDEITSADVTIPDVTPTEDETYYEPATDAEIVTEPDTEAVTNDYSEPATEPATEDVFVPNTPASSLPISDSDFILLCNVVAHEAGSQWISSYEKAYVAEVVMNRVYSPLYPNTVYGVLTQPYQFSGNGAYVNLGTYSSYVTEAVKEAVRLYFSEPESFTQGYMSFYGDGVRNYFR